MDTFGSLFAPGSVLSEQIARQVFDILPEPGIILAIRDKNGNCWPSDSEIFDSLNISHSFLDELCAKIDDGQEPVITEHNNVSIIAAQLCTDQTNCGYVVIALPRCGPESALANIDLLEIIISQVNLIAKLIEQNDRLYERQMKHFATYCCADQPSN